MARIVADALGSSFSQSVVPINKPGASGIIADETVARAAPDGYTLLIAVNAHAANPALFKKLPYNTLKDFTAIASLGKSPLVLVASEATGVKTVKTLLSLGKQKPEAMLFGVTETSTRVATERLSSATGIPMTVVNYKGTGPAMTDLAGGHVNFTVTTIASTASLKGSGKMNYVGLMALNRSPLLPGVPTLAEQGIPGMEASAWWGLLGPANMPKAIVQRISVAISAALADPKVKRRLDTLSIEAWASSPDEFDTFIRDDVALTLKVAKKAGIEPE